MNTARSRPRNTRVNEDQWSSESSGGGGGDRGAGARENRGGRGTGGGRRKGGKRDSQSGGNPGEKKKNFAILRNLLPSQSKEAGTPMEGGGKRE